MKVMFDTNILLDVFQNRQPHYADSAGCLNKAIHGDIEGYIPAHVLTTFYYVLKKHRDAQTARDAVTWLLERLRVASCDHAVLEEACRCEMSDYEDAVVAASAQQAGCTHILTRNASDFAKSPVPVVSPPDLLGQLTNS
ncbi:MAG: PIN domain-containing protein [bacterium]|nr:PIN domain-containing protein [bacterium]